MTCIQSKRLFCKNCSCTYTSVDGKCLRCETDKNYEKTLAKDNSKAAYDKEVLSKDVCQNQHEPRNQDLLTKHEILSAQDLRYAGLCHFRRRQMTGTQSDHKLRISFIRSKCQLKMIIRMKHQ